MNSLLSVIKTNWGLFTLVILGVITFLSLWPLEKLPSAPGSDKAHHVIVYAILMLPAALRKPNKWLVLGFFFIIYSGGIELLQPYVNRHGEWLDMAANTLGIATGVIVATLLNALFPTASARSR